MGEVCRAGCGWSCVIDNPCTDCRFVPVPILQRVSSRSHGTGGKNNKRLGNLPRRRGYCRHVHSSGGVGLLFFLEEHAYRIPRITVDHCQDSFLARGSDTRPIAFPTRKPLQQWHRGRACPVQSGFTCSHIAAMVYIFLPRAVLIYRSTSEARKSSADHAITIDFICLRKAEVPKHSGRYQPDEFFERPRI